MQRTKLRNGMNVQVKTNYHNTKEAVIVDTDVDFAHRTHRVANGRGGRYRFQGSWNQAIAVAIKRTDGEWVPAVTTTRNVLDTVEGYRLKEQEEADARIVAQVQRAERAEVATAQRAARLRHNPEVVDALNEFVGSSNAFSVSYNGQIVTNSTAVVNALTEALGLEVN